MYMFYSFIVIEQSKNVGCFVTLNKNYKQITEEPDV